MDTGDVQPVPPQSFVRRVRLKRIPLPHLRREFGDFEGEVIALANGERYNAEDAIAVDLTSGVRVEKAKGRGSMLLVSSERYVWAFKLDHGGWTEYLNCTPIDMSVYSMEGLDLSKGGKIRLSKGREVEEEPSNTIEQPHWRELDIRFDETHVRKRWGWGEMLRFTSGDRWANFVFEQRRWWRLHPHRFPEADTRGQMRRNHVFYPIPEGTIFASGEIVPRPFGNITVGGKVYAPGSVISQPFSLGHVSRGHETNWLTTIDLVEGDSVKLHFEKGEWCRWYETEMPMSFWERHTQFAASDPIVGLVFRFARSVCGLAQELGRMHTKNYCD